MLNEAITQWTEGISYQTKLLADIIPDAQRWVLGANCSGVSWSAEFEGNQRYAKMDQWLKRQPRDTTVALCLGDMSRQLNGRWPQKRDYISMSLIAVGSFEQPAIGAILRAEGDAPFAIWQATTGLWVIVWRLGRPMPYLSAKRMADGYAQQLGCRALDVAPLPNNPSAVRFLRTELHENSHRNMEGGHQRTDAGNRNDRFEKPSRSVAPDTSSAGEDYSRQLAAALSRHGVAATVTRERTTPVAIVYAVRTTKGIPLNKMEALAPTLAMELGKSSVRIRPLPDRMAFGVEIPRLKRDMVDFDELMGHEAVRNSPSALLLALGIGEDGAPVLADLARMPHLLIAGTTGSGKSVGMNVMLLSLMLRMSPDQVRFILVDPKMTEFMPYDGVPHLLTPVIVEIEDAITALAWVATQMKERQARMAALKVRTIAKYNDKIAEMLRSGEAPDGEFLEPMHYIVIVIDEFADLVLSEKYRAIFLAAVQKIAQMGRSAGIHMMAATQSPHKEVVPGTIKANLPAKVCFQVTSTVAAGVVGMSGAECLLSMGDSLVDDNTGRVRRTQFAFISDERVEECTADLRELGEPDYVDFGTSEVKSNADESCQEGMDEFDAEGDDATVFGRGAICEREAVPDFGTQRGDKKKRACQWLGAMLRENGTMPSSLLTELASKEEPPIAATTLFEASRVLNVQKTNPSPDGKYKVGQSQLWSLRC
jgi:hypothetical protein